MDNTLYGVSGKALLMRVSEERPKRMLGLSVLDKTVLGKCKGLAYPRANKFGISKSNEICVAGVDP